ncbi:MAG: aldo/keto reductase [Candidatus Solibacter usitatus]|nr:aldo/keto reductase [Candidatus Solibacter usitatus]
MTNAPRALTSFTESVLGRTGLRVGRLGLGASYGVPAAAVERAFERGVNYFYWGSLRRLSFARAIRNLASRRDRMVITLQSFSRVAGLVGWSVEHALRRLRLDYADVLLLGLWNRPVTPRVLDAARALRDRGLVRRLALSTHQRPLVPQLAAEFDIFHVRYNAVHPGAERDIFPHLAGETRPGIVGFTATCWKQLLSPRRVPRGERIPTAADCYRFVLSHPAVDICLTGPSNSAHMDQALAALALGPMSAEELEWMRRVGRAIRDR